MKPYTLFLLAVLFVFLISGCKSPGQDDANINLSSSDHHPIAVYFYNGEVSQYKNYSQSYLEHGNIFPDDVKNIIDVLYYSFAYPQSDGSVVFLNEDGLNECMELQKTGTKIIVSISGVSANDSSIFSDISKSDDLVDLFADNIIEFVEKYGFDGVDIDWEAVNPEIKPNSVGMNRIMSAIRSKMNARSSSTGKTYFLSCAVPSSPWGLGEDRFDFNTLNSLVDYVNLMSYDLNKEDTSSHLCPLYTSSFDNGYECSTVYGVNKLMSSGIDSSKILVGIAGYGKAYTLKSADSDNKYPGLGKSAKLTNLNLPGAFDSGTVFGYTISCAKDLYDLKEFSEMTDDKHFVASYLYDSDSNIFITYDSPAAIKEKYNFVQNYQGMGLMVWCYTEDTDNHVVNTLKDLS